jgi:molecular chaperone GrpE
VGVLALAPPSKNGHAMEDNHTRSTAGFSDAPAEDTQDAQASSSRASVGGSEQTDLERQRDEYKDLLLRKSAEFDNFRKRTDRERQTLSDTLAADVLQELLPLVDDLERALEAVARPETADAYRRGVELIHKQLLDLLRRRGVRPIEAVGTRFDPNVHEAVSHEVVPGHSEGDVVGEFRRGYMIGDRLLRPAMVRVAKGAQ